MKVKINCVTQPYNKNPDAKTITPEEYMISCARVSSPENRLNHETAPKLLKYLIDSGHWSPFEMISIGVEIETSRAIGTQLLRHRSFSFQEFSQRYAEVEAIEPVELRLQAEKNRQSSTVETKNRITQRQVKEHVKESLYLYENLIRNGIAKECARMILPLATQTTLVMHGTLRSWIHFLDQRCSDHAQKEIRLIAVEIRKQLTVLCPWTAKALNWSNENEN